MLFLLLILGSPQTSHLVKDLQVGENVRAVGGVNAGHSGLITSIDFNRQTATVFSPAAGLEVCGLCVLILFPPGQLATPPSFLLFYPDVLLGARDCLLVLLFLGLVELFQDSVFL